MQYNSRRKNEVERKNRNDRTSKCSNTTHRTWSEDCKFQNMQEVGQPEKNSSIIVIAKLQKNFSILQSRGKFLNKVIMGCWTLFKKYDFLNKITSL